MNGSVKYKTEIEIKILAPSLEVLLRDNLGIMNDILKKGGCDNAGHFDCQMCTEISTDNATDLLIDFLSDTLSLTYMQKILFCNVYFAELSENSISAQLYGKWLGGFDERIRGVSYLGTHVKRNEENVWESHVTFDM
ncbi:MAG: archease [Muricauda sp.]|nr:archease [Allomuricauda sp.]MBA4746568.1 archease [Allomuricauda sp.]